MDDNSDVAGFKTFSWKRRLQDYSVMLSDRHGLIPSSDMR